jgi:hypothetical protein
VLAGFAWLRNRPVEDILVVGLLVLAFVFLILAYAPAAIATITPVPFVITVQGVLKGQTNIQAHVTILNRRPNRRLALHLGLCLRDDLGREYWITQAVLSDLKLSLGPEEYTEGTIAFDCGFGHNKVPAHTECRLRIVDMISNRSATFRIPGTHPSNASLQSINTPKFHVTGRPSGVVAGKIPRD